MPVIRCSNEVYRLLQEKALQDDEPMSIVLDRIVFLELKKPKPKIEPGPKPKRKARAKAKAKSTDSRAKAWPWTRESEKHWICGKCGNVLLEENRATHEGVCKKGGV